MWEPADWNAATWDLIFSAALVAATLVSLGVTGIMAWQNRLLRKAQFDPHVSVYLRISDRSINLYELVVHNDGGSPAYDLKFAIEQDFAHPNSKRLVGSFLDREWKFLGAGQARDTSFGSAIVLGKIEEGIAATLSVSWRSASGEKFTEAKVLDLRDFLGTSGAFSKPAYEISNSLEKLASAAEAMRHEMRRARYAAENVDD